MGNLEDRFWAKVDKSGECWEWMGMKDSSGYGQFRLPERRIAAHRYSYQIAHGPVESRMQIDHRCHNRRCVKPGHLRAVTCAENLENRKGPNSNGSSGVLNVSWCATKERYRATFKKAGRVINAGSFKTLEAAEAAVKQRRLEILTYNDRDRS